MKFVSITEGEIVITLEVEDAILLARACDTMAQEAFTQDGPKLTSQVYAALSMSLEAASMAAAAFGHFAPSSDVRNYTLATIMTTRDTTMLETDDLALSA